MVLDHHRFAVRSALGLGQHRIEFFGAFLILITDGHDLLRLDAIGEYEQATQDSFVDSFYELGICYFPY